MSKPKLLKLPTPVEINDYNYDMVKVFFHCQQRVCYDCSVCGKHTEKYLFTIEKPVFLCRKHQIEATAKERYGSVEAMQRMNIAHGNETKKKLYGDEHYTNIEKMHQTKLEKYGDATFTNREKCFNTIKERYGVDNPHQIKSAKEKFEKTCIERYNVINPAKKPEFVEKAKQTSIDNWGVSNPAKSDAVKEKVRNTNRKLFNADYPLQNPDKLKELEQMNIEKYGSAHPQFKHFYQYDGLYFDSSWELYFYIYHKDNDADIERDVQPIAYTYNGESHLYYPDFSVNGKLYEIKGNQFFNKDGTMRNPYNSEQDGLFEAKHQCGIKNNVTFIKNEDIQPIISWVDKKYTEDYVRLFKLGTPFPYLNPRIRVTTDNGLIHHFHKSIYDASYKGNVSPAKAWLDKNLVKKSALNRLKYIGTCTPQDVLQGFNVAKIAPKVSLFKPKLAQRLIETYLSEFDTVFDPFSGFSGRMLGAYNAGKKYIGSDINPDHVFESNEIIEFKRISDVASVTLQDILTAEPAEYECLFTCPPYGGKEHWNENNDEIEHTCDEWIDICLEKFKCRKYLFVVDTTEKYKGNIVETLSNKSHFGTNYEHVILIEK